jgi:hypothetical protein
MAPLLKQEPARYEHREGACIQLKNLTRPRHFDASVRKKCCELPHDVFFVVNKKCSFRAGLLLSSHQLRLIGMGGETINGVDTSPNSNILAEDVHLLDAVNNLARESSRGCVADDQDARILAPEIVPEVVAHAAAVHMPEPAVMMAPLWTLFIATDSAVFRVECKPGKANGSSPS